MKLEDAFKALGLLAGVAGATWQWHAVGLMAAALVVFGIGWAMTLVDR